IVLPVFGAVPSWRLTFLIVGFPGIVVALFVYTIREPLRQQALRNASGEVTKLSLGDVIREMRLRWQSVVGVSLSLAFQSSCNYSLLAWAPTFFIRVHGWTAAKTGSVLGTIVLFMGCSGAYVGGLLSDRWQRQGLRESTLRVGYIASIGAAIFASVAM